MLLAWLILHWGILPRLDTWRPEIEARLSAAIGAPLRIGRIQVRSGSWVPAFEVDDVRLLDGQGRIALQVGRVSAALSPASLLTMHPRFAQLHVDGVQLDVQRDAAGRVFVAGLGLDGAAALEGHALVDWFFAQHEFVIRHGTLRWTDALHAAPPLQLSDVDLVLRNTGLRHDWRFDATPPEDWGKRFALRGRFTQPLLARAGDWQQWNGTLYADLPLADVSQLRQHLSLPFDLRDGRGALRAWVDIEKGRSVRGTADLALAAVALQVAPTLPPLVLAQLEGRLSAHRDAQTLALDVARLRFLTDDGVAWAPSTLQLSLQQGPPDADGVAAPVTGGTLAVDRLDLAPLARLAARLPLPEPMRRSLAELAPQGVLQGVKAEWRGPVQALQRYRVRARAVGLAIAAGMPKAGAIGRPGVRGADLEIDATEEGGQAKLNLSDGELVFPGVFEQPTLAMDSLQAGVGWRIHPGQGAGPSAWEVNVQDVRFANADGRGGFSGSWRTGPGAGTGPGRRFPGQIDLTGRIVAADAARVARYLPLGVPESARRYVEQAVGPGRISDADFRAKGDLWHFPYVDGEPGSFIIRAHVQDLSLAYVPSEPGWTSPWPAMSAVTGELEFDRGAMRLHDTRALLSGVPLRGVHGGIADLVHRPVLKLEGQASASLADLLRFVNTTPVTGWMGDALKEARAGGVADLALSLTLPVDDPGAGRVRGAVQLAGNDLRLRPDTPLLAGARGRVDFTEHGFSIVGGRARVLGGDASFEGGSQTDGSVRVVGQGVATADALLGAKEVPALAPLAVLGPGRLRGQAPYRLQLGFAAAGPELLVTSSLAGMSIDLPAPLGKLASATRPLRVQTTRGPGAAGTDQFSVDLGDILQLRLESDPRRVGTAALRGSLGLGTAAPPMPPMGIRALLRLPQLDLDAWRPLMPATVGVADAGSDLPPTQLSLETATLAFGGRRLTGVALELQRQPGLADTRWLAQLRADQAAGTVEWRQPREAGTPGRLTARLTHLSVPSADAGLVEDMIEKAPPSVPALDLVIDDFRWRGKVFGKVELEAVNRDAPDRPGVREWQLDRLRISAPDATLEGGGRWSAGRRMALDFTLDLADSGHFAERMGGLEGLKGGKGRIKGQLSWAGSPLSFDLASLRGGLNIALAEGRILNAEPGAARLLGVLSLQALPRRFLLDFQDLFEKGFAFDRVDGEVTLDDGVARTRNLRLVGLQAAVLVEGQTDLMRETQDLRIVAVPEIDAGSASLAYAVINPAVGLGAFLAQWLLRQPMMAAATREFHVTGSWADPKVERVNRSPAATAAASAAASANQGRNP